MLFRDHVRNLQWILQIQKPVPSCPLPGGKWRQNIASVTFSRALHGSQNLSKQWRADARRKASGKERLLVSLRGWLHESLDFWQALVPSLWFQESLRHSFSACHVCGTRLIMCVRHTKTYQHEPLEIQSDKHGNEGLVHTWLTLCQD